jgi:hypothetical protein
MSKRPSFANVAALNRRPMMSDPPPGTPETVQEIEPSESVTAEPTTLPVPQTAYLTSAATRTRPGVRGDQEDRRPVRRGKRALTFWVNPEPHKQFKMLSVREERPGQDLLEEALDDLFAKYGMHRIARQS